MMILCMLGMSYHTFMEIMSGEVADGAATVHGTPIRYSDSGDALIINEGMRPYEILLLEDAPRPKLNVPCLLTNVLVSKGFNMPSIIASSETVVLPTPGTPSRSPPQSTCEDCDDGSTPYCPKTGNKHGVCKNCLQLKSTSPFCGTTGLHH